MATSLANDYRVRKSFGKIKHIVEIPNLIEMQRESYERFLQQEVDPDERVDKGLQGVFKGVFPIRDFSGTASLEFVRYSIGRVKYDVEECLQRGILPRDLLPLKHLLVLKFQKYPRKHKQ